MWAGAEVANAGLLGDYPWDLPISLAGSHFLMRPGRSCGPCLDKGPRDKAGGRGLGGKGLWQLLRVPKGSRKEMGSLEGLPNSCYAH